MMINIMNLENYLKNLEFNYKTGALIGLVTGTVGTIIMYSNPEVRNQYSNSALATGCALGTLESTLAMCIAGYIHQAVIEPTKRKLTKIIENRGNLSE